MSSNSASSPFSKIVYPEPDPVATQKAIEFVRKMIYTGAQVTLTGPPGSFRVIHLKTESGELRNVDWPTVAAAAKLMGAEIKTENVEPYTSA